MNNELDTSRDTDDEPARDDRSAESEQGSSSSSTDVKAPFAPHVDDDSAFGDTDQHSTA